MQVDAHIRSDILEHAAVHVIGKEPRLLQEIAMPFLPCHMAKHCGLACRVASVFIGILILLMGPH